MLVWSLPVHGRRAVQLQLRRHGQASATTISTAAMELDSPRRSCCATRPATESYSFARGELITFELTRAQPHRPDGDPRRSPSCRPAISAYSTEDSRTPALEVDRRPGFPGGCPGSGLRAAGDARSFIAEWNQVTGSGEHARHGRIRGPRRDPVRPDSRPIRWPPDELGSNLRGFTVRLTCTPAAFLPVLMAGTSNQEPAVKIIPLPGRSWPPPSSPCPAAAAPITGALDLPDFSHLRAQSPWIRWTSLSTAS